MYLVTEDKSECCGCTACEAICTTRALSMQRDEEGFLYPVKDTDKCTDCGLCEKVCAFAHPQYATIVPRVFATYVKNEEERKKSASGALFYAIAQKVIVQGGVVCGAVMDEYLQVRHQVASTMEGVQTFRGSKYVQSDMCNCFREVKNLLKANRFVYFTGTPCQVAGLKAFLRKDYSNLLTSDLVCHGVPSQTLFDTHIDYLKKKHHTRHIYNYQFRDYFTAGGCEIFNFTNPRGKVRQVKHPSYVLSPFLYSFMHAFTFRMSCYQCPFARLPRQGDISLADFWGAQHYHKEMNGKYGISLILLNTEKGEEYWMKVKSEIDYVESDVEKAACYNKNLVQPTVMPPIRKGIYKRVETEGYDKLAKTIFRSPDHRKTSFKFFLRKMVGDRLDYIYHIIKEIKKHTTV